MTIEQKIKMVLGDQQFNLIVMSSQLEEAHKKIAAQQPKKDQEATPTPPEE